MLRVTPQPTLANAREDWVLADLRRERRNLLKPQQVRCASYSLHWLVWKRGLERAMGIEPTAQAWEAWVLPLYDARTEARILVAFRRWINAAPSYTYATKF